METCAKCGAALTVGEWPFCPHGRGRSVVIGDECDVVIENNGTPHPIRFRSKADMKAHMDAHNLAPFVRHVPTPGSDRSPHTTNWAQGMDAYTLEAARILTERAATQRREPAPPPIPFTGSMRVLESVITGKVDRE